MHNNALPFPLANSLDLFRISRAKRIADVSPNTLRKYHEEFGLRIYYCGGAAWVSKSELEAIIRNNSSLRPKARKKSIHVGVAENGPQTRAEKNAPL